MRNQAVFCLLTFLPCLQTGSLNKMDQAIIQESYDLFEANNLTYSRVNIMESSSSINNSLNILKVSQAFEEEREIGDKFQLSLGQKLAILVSLWLLASLISLLAWPCTPLRRAVGLEPDEDKSWFSWGWSWLSWSSWQDWWYADQHS